MCRLVLDIGKACIRFSFGPFHVQIRIQLGHSRGMYVSISVLVHVYIILLVHFLFRFAFILEIQKVFKYYCFDAFQIRVGCTKGMKILYLGPFHVQIRIHLGCSQEK